MNVSWCLIGRRNFVNYSPLQVKHEYCLGAGTMCVGQWITSCCINSLAIEDKSVGYNVTHHHPWVFSQEAKVWPPPLSVLHHITSSSIQLSWAGSDKLSCGILGTFRDAGSLKHDHTTGISTCVCEYDDRDIVTKQLNSYKTLEHMIKWNNFKSESYKTVEVTKQ